MSKILLYRNTPESLLIHVSVLGFFFLFFLSSFQIYNNFQRYNFALIHNDYSCYISL